MLSRTADLVARDNALSDFRYYYYTPSMGAAVLFIILFFLTTLLHFYQMIRTRTWFMIPFCIGGIFEITGYIGRALSSNEAPNFTVGPYVLQATLLLVAPALLAASIYMELARIVLMIDGERELFIRRTWLTKIFVSGDVLSFLLQSAGGGLMAGHTNSSVTIGRALVLVGLVLQIVYFGVFVLTGVIFHIRMRKRPTQECGEHRWQRHMTSLYIVGALIFVRSIVRVVEYVQGFDGYIMTHEAFLYVFDALLMFLAMVEMNWTHPSEVAAAIRRDGKASEQPMSSREAVWVQVEPVQGDLESRGSADFD